MENIKAKFEHIAQPTLVLPMLLGFSMLGLVLFSFIGDMRCGFGRASSLELSPRAPDVITPDAPPTLHKWSILAILALTSYRFYTGFLNSTWMPYLLAMEGANITADRQSFFMGTAKLIYGLSILLNPIFGLVGDQLAVVSHWTGRRLFILGGVATSGLGIYGCIVSAQNRQLGWYMAGLVLWMLGEAMADVTTETLVPELLPRSQYEISSSLRSLNFLLGGLGGYVMLIVFRHVHYSWLYYGYLLVMLLCALLSLSFINTDDLQKRKLSTRPHRMMPFSQLVSKAYLAPSRMEGGFPGACLCLFTFCLGTAPVFFLLLMVRDVVGIKERDSLQLHFGLISIVFFICAAIASMLSAALSQAPTTNSCLPDDEAMSERAPVSEGCAIVSWRWHTMIGATVAFGITCILTPLPAFMPSLETRLASFYVVAMLFGLAFGAVYCRFQECTWSLLTPGTDVANAMGFAAMAKMAGLGFGNFGAGIVLDFYVANSHHIHLPGYFVMCFLCAGIVFVAAYGVRRISFQVLAACPDDGQEVADCSKRTHQQSLVEHA